MRRVLSATYRLMVRAVRETLRQPGVEAGNLFILLFFFFVTVGAIGRVAGQAFGVVDYKSFEVPVAVVQGVAGAAAASGVAVVTDIERGYFDKLLLTPAPRLAIVWGRLLADAVRSAFFVAVILAVTAVAGAHMAAGAAGYAAVLLLGAAFGAAYSGIGLAIGLRTGNAQAAQAGFLLFFPLLFLSPAFAPREVFQGWLNFLAGINPVTYMLEGMRAVALTGWDWGHVLGAFASVLGLGLVTTVLSVLALRSRTG
jgi:ABC-2 type transport system permease protein